MMSPTIRPMTEEDRPAIIQMLRCMPEFKPIEVDTAEEILNSYLQNPTGSGYHVFVAETNSSITGYICFGPAPLTETSWDIYWLAVAPSGQRRGIGRALLAYAEERINRSGGRLALIETSSTPEYERARRFYRSQGYKSACRIKDFYAPGDDKIIFQKRLR